MMTAFILATASGVRGQSGDAVVITQRVDVDFFKLETLDLGLELSYLHRNYSSRMSGALTSEETEDQYRETLELAGTGYFGHPNIADLDFRLRFAFEQKDLESDRVVNQNSNEFINEFDVNTMLFKKTTMPVLVYGRRDQVNVNQTFGGSINSTVTELGTQVQFIGGFAPQLVSYFHRIQEYDSTQINNNYRIVQDTVQSAGSLVGIVPGQLSWDYTFDDSTETGERRSLNSFQRHDLDVNHRLRISKENSSNMYTTVHYRRETGDRDLNRFRFNEKLTLIVTQDLDVFLDYNYVNQVFGGPRQIRREGSARFNHHLFESLTTSGGIGVQELQIREEDFESTQYTGLLSFDYTKSVPYGRLDASVNLTRIRRDSTEMGVSVSNVDESRTFNAADSIVIAGRNILTTSIFITDVTGLIVYLEGLDYELFPFADRLEIRRTLTSNIIAGQTVLVDYVLGPEPGGRIDTDSQLYSVRYAFDDGALRGLSLYLRYRHMDETRPDLGFIDFQEADLDDLVAGVEFARERLSVGGEWQQVDSISPFDRYTLFASYVWPFGNGGRIGLNAAYSETDSHESDILSRVTTISANLDQRLGQQWRMNYRFRWRKEDDTSGRESEGFDHVLDTRWQYRQTSLIAEIRSNMLSTNTSDNDLFSIGLRFRREF